MNTNNANTDLINEIENSIDGVLGIKTIHEAYVTEPKKFHLKTDLLSDKLKKAREEEFEKTVNHLNRLSAELDATDKNEVSSYNSEFRNFKLDEIYNYNLSFLKAAHFENISDLNSKINMDMFAYMRLVRDFGTFDEWQKDFIACCMASRGGFAITAFSLRLGRYMNFFVDSDMRYALDAIPLIVLDVSEGAYYRDYLNDKKTYVHGMMKELNWDKIEERFMKAERISKI
jgi:Fe-Mn family superoxide dismutase